MESWLLMGDFNSLLMIDDKEGGQLVTNYELWDFDLLVQACGLVDLRSIGYRLTWTNGMVYCKLDHALANSHWFLADYDSFVEFTPPRCLSNHSCCIVSTMVRDQGPKQPFKFNMWALHRDFHGLVVDSWEVSVLGNTQFTLKAKLTRLKERL